MDNTIRTTSVESKVITALRFPMTYLVVLLHTILQDQVCNGWMYAPIGAYPIFDGFVFFTQRCVGDLAVPTFFFISGYLYFHGKEFCFSVYGQKNKKRIRSLLIPYLLWNLLFMVFLLVIYHFQPSVLSSTKTICEELSWESVLLSFWNYNGAPILAPFWYIRDLIVISFFTIPIYYLVKIVHVPFLLTLFLLWTFSIGIELPGIGVRSLAFYVFGAYFSVHHKNFDLHMGRVSFLMTVIFLLFSILLYLINMNHFWGSVVHQIMLLSGVVAVIGLSCNYVEKIKIFSAPILVESSFFIFSIHMFFINIPNKFWPLLLPVNEITLCFMQLFIPVLVCLVSIIFYFYLKKYFSTILSLFVGGRFDKQLKIV